MKSGSLCKCIYDFVQERRMYPTITFPTKNETYTVLEVNPEAYPDAAPLPTAGIILVEISNEPVMVNGLWCNVWFWVQRFVELQPPIEDVINNILSMPLEEKEPLILEPELEPETIR